MTRRVLIATVAWVAVTAALLAATVTALADPNPPARGPYWNPCAHGCLGTACVQTTTGHAWCTQPPGSAVHGRRHDPTRRLLVNHGQALRAATGAVLRYFGPVVWLWTLDVGANGNGTWSGSYLIAQGRSVCQGTVWVSYAGRAWLSHGPGRGCVGR